MNSRQAESTSTVNREAHYLDAQDWDAWIALYTEDCEFWMPAWKSEHVLTNDPCREISLIYYRNRAGLEDRVARVRSGRSVASIPLPRTQHALTNVWVQCADDENTCLVQSNWTVHQFNTKRRQVEVLFGRYEHALEWHDGQWRIRRKKIILLNDNMQTMLDFYSI